MNRQSIRWRTNIDLAPTNVDGNNAMMPTSIFSLANGNLRIDGHPPQRVPKRKTTDWVEYAKGPGNRGKITYLTSFALTDEFPTAGRPANANPLAIAPSFLHWQARVSGTNARNQWSVGSFPNFITHELGLRSHFA